MQERHREATDSRAMFHAQTPWMIACVLREKGKPVPRLETFMLTRGGENEEESAPETLASHFAQTFGPK